MTDAQVTAYSHSEDGAVAVHSHGGETTWRILIAADWLRSTARKLSDAAFAGTCARCEPAFT